MHKSTTVTEKSYNRLFLTDNFIKDDLVPELLNARNSFVSEGRPRSFSFSHVLKGNDAQKSDFKLSKARSFPHLQADVKSNNQKEIVIFYNEKQFNEFIQLRVELNYRRMQQHDEDMPKRMRKMPKYRLEVWMKSFEEGGESRELLESSATESWLREELQGEEERKECKAYLKDFYLEELDSLREEFGSKEILFYTKLPQDHPYKKLPPGHSFSLVQEKVHLSNVSGPSAVEFLAESNSRQAITDVLWTPFWGCGTELAQLADQDAQDNDDINQPIPEIMSYEMLLERVHQQINTENLKLKLLLDDGIKLERIMKLLSQQRPPKSRSEFLNGTKPSDEQIFEERLKFEEGGEYYTALKLRIGPEDYLNDLEIKQDHHIRLEADIFLKQTVQGGNILFPKDINTKIHVLNLYAHGQPGDRLIYARQNGEGNMSANALVRAMTRLKFPSPLVIQVWSCYSASVVEPKNFRPEEIEKSSWPFIFDGEVHRAFIHYFVQALEKGGFQAIVVGFPGLGMSSILGTYQKDECKDQYQIMGKIIAGGVLSVTEKKRSEEIKQVVYTSRIMDFIDELPLSWQEWLKNQFSESVYF